jgi:hypothetical protein
MEWLSHIVQGLGDLVVTVTGGLVDLAPVSSAVGLTLAVVHLFRRESIDGFRRRYTRTYAKTTAKDHAINVIVMPFITIDALFDKVLAKPAPIFFIPITFIAMIFAVVAVGKVGTAGVLALLAVL